MSRAEDVNMVIKCLIELGQKEKFDIEGDIHESVKAITPRIKPMLFERGLRFSKSGLSNLLWGAYFELDFPDAIIAQRMKERLEDERTKPRDRSKHRERDADKEERISKALVKWFLTTHRLTLDSKNLPAGSMEAVAEFKKLMNQAELGLPADDAELVEYFGDVIIEMDMPPER